MNVDAPASLVIGLYPFDTPGNEYIARNREILNRLGRVVEVPRARRLLQAMMWDVLRFRSPKMFDIVILNWPERLLVLRGNELTTRGVLEYFLFLQLVRLASRRLVYVRHNKTAHGIAEGDRERVARLIDRGEARSDAVVCHSPAHAEERGYHYVPHPLYKVSPTRAGALKDEYLVFGRIAPYKQIDRLIEAWSSEQTLAVVGRPTDDEYISRLRELAAGKAVRFEIGFKDEADVAGRVAASRGVIIVNDRDSAIVSGTFFFAVSSGASVLALADPFYDWVRSTRLGEYVHAFDSVGALVRHADRAAGETAAVAAGRMRIVRDEAARLFGDDVVRDAWRSVFAAIGANVSGKAARPALADRS